MNIKDLLEKFIHAKNNYSYDNYDFFNAINTVADYVMYEQAIILKNNIDRNNATITYVYDNFSSSAIEDFYDSITFLSEPVIGSAKSVIIQGESDEELSKKIYVIDKIKDSLMHLSGDNTKYVFSSDNKKMTIRNVMSDYSLECVIDISALRHFCDLIKSYYVDVDNELEWIDYLRMAHNSGYDVIDKIDRVIKIETIEGTPEKIYSCTSNKGVVVRTESDYQSYHTYSYLTSLNSERKDNYPILPSLYSKNVFCENSSYKEQCQSILNTMNSKYISLTHNVTNKHITSDKKLSQAISFLDYTIKSIGSLNGHIIRSLRNARAHANKTSNDDCDIYFFDVDDNTTVNDDFKFGLRIQKQQLMVLLNEINLCPTPEDFTNILHSEISSKEFNLLYEYIEYLYMFLNYCLFNGYDTKDLLINLSEYGNVVDLLSSILLQEEKRLERK